MADIQTLLIELDARTQRFESQMRASNRLLRQTQKEARGTQAQFKAMTPTVARLTKAFRGLGGALGVASIGAATAAFTSAFRASAALASEIEDLARASNLSTEEFQVFARAGEDFGVTFQQAGDILREFNLRLGEARIERTGTLFEQLERLQIPTEIGGQARETRAVLLDLVGAIEAAATAQERAFIADEAFGGEGAQYATALATLGVDGLRLFRRELQSTNRLLSGESVESLSAAQQTLREFGQTYDAISTEVFAGIINNARSIRTEVLSTYRDIAVGVESVLNAITLPVAESETSSALLRFFGLDDQALADAAQRVRGAVSEVVAALSDRVTGGDTDYLTRAEEQLRALGLVAEDTAERTIKANTRAGAKTREEQQRTLEQARTLLEQGRSASEVFRDDINRLADALRDLDKAGELTPERIAQAARVAAGFREELEAATETAEKLNNTLDETASGDTFVRLAEQAGTSADVIDGSFQSAGGSIADSIAQAAVSGRLSFRQLALSVISDISRMIARMLVFRSLAALGGALFSAAPGINASTGGVGGFGGLIPLRQGPGFAQGGVIDAGEVVPFAAGGVIGSPTVFPMARGAVGLVGEAGPEAILPLERTASGDLGVKASGAGGMVFAPSVEVNVVHNGPASDEESQKMAQRVGRETRKQLEELIRVQLRDEQRPGGIFNPTVV